MTSYWGSEPLQLGGSRRSPGFAGILTALLLACGLLASHAGIVHADQGTYSGFLGADENYHKLEQVNLSSGDKAMRWISPSLSLANYKQVLIEPAVLYPEPEPTPQVSAETLQQIEEHLTNGIRKRVGEVLQTTDTPAPGVVRIEPAVTGVVIKTQGIKAYEVLPVAAVFGGVKAAAGKRKQDVRVFMEVRLTDSESGELLGMVVRTVEGEPLKGKKEELKLGDVEDNLNTVTDDARASIEDMLVE